MSYNIQLRDVYKQRLELDQQQEEEIREMYCELIEVVEKDIHNLSDKTNISSVMREFQLQKIKNGLQRSLETVGVRVNGVVRQSMTTTSQQMVDATKIFLGNAGFPKPLIRPAYQNVPTAVIERVASGQLYEGDWTLSGAIWADVKSKQSEINRIIAQGIALNKSSYEIAKDLEMYVSPDAKKPWDWDKVYPGSSKKIDYNAQRLARTAVSHAYQQAFNECVKPNPFVEAVKWNNAHSGRVCPLCIELAETDQFGLGEGVFPKGEEPLDHPNGMCYLTAVIRKNMEEIATDIRSWMLGGSNPELDEYAKFLNPEWGLKSKS